MMIDLERVPTVQKAVPAKKFPWAGAAVATVVLLAIAGGVIVRSRVTPPLKQYDLLVEAVPEGARITIDGAVVGEAPQRKPLTPGEHQIELRKQGFKDLVKKVTLGEKPDRITLTMEPDGLAVHFVSDYRGMTLKLDGKPFLDEEQKASVDGLLAFDDGVHVFELISGSITARFGLEMKAGAAAVRGPALANQTKVAVLVSPARWLLPADVEVLVDGASISKKQDTVLAPSKHQLKMGSFEAPFETGERPEAFVFLTSGRLVGDLSIVTSVSDAEIYLDGVRNQMRTPVKIPSVPVRNVRLRVEKAGYESYSAVVPIQANTVTYVNATLKKLP